MPGTPDRLARVADQLLVAIHRVTLLQEEKDRLRRQHDMLQLENHVLRDAVATLSARLRELESRGNT